MRKIIQSKYIYILIRLRSDPSGKRNTACIGFLQSNEQKKAIYWLVSNYRTNDQPRGIIHFSDVSFFSDFQFNL